MAGCCKAEIRNEYYCINAFRLKSLFLFRFEGKPTLRRFTSLESIGIGLFQRSVPVRLLIGPPETRGDRPVAEQAGPAELNDPRSRLVPELAPPGPRPREVPDDLFCPLPPANFNTGPGDRSPCR